MSIQERGNIYYSFQHEKNPTIQDETFYDSSEFEWVGILESNWKVIFEEVHNYLHQEKNDLKPYFAEDMTNTPGNWKAFSFYFWGLPMSKSAMSKCPETIKVVKRLPHLVSCSVSIMESQSEIKPHYGDTDAVYRGHLGLMVPEKLPNCGFRVGYEDRSWQEGKVLLFNDAAYHKAWNFTNSRRVVLLFDLLKPEHANQKVWICAKVRAGILWQIIAEKTGVFKAKKNYFTRVMAFLLTIPTYFLLSWEFRKSASLK